MGSEPIAPYPGLVGGGSISHGYGCGGHVPSLASPHSGALAAGADAVAPLGSRRLCLATWAERRGLGRPGRRPGRDRRPGPGPRRRCPRLRSVECRCAPRHRLDPRRLADHAGWWASIRSYLPVDGRDPAVGHAGRPGGVAALAAPGRLPRQRRCGRAGRLPVALLVSHRDHGRQDHRELGDFLVSSPPVAGLAVTLVGMAYACCRPASPGHGASGRRAPRSCSSRFARMYLAVDHPTDLLSAVILGVGSRWSPSASLPPTRSTR